MQAGSEVSVSSLALSACTMVSGLQSLHATQEGCCCLNLPNMQAALWHGHCTPGAVVHKKATRGLSKA